MALNLKAAGWEVSVIDEREEALGRLGDHWTGEFHVGHGMDISLLRQAGITCMYRVTNAGAGAADGLAVGVPQEVIVRAEDVASANEVLGD